MRTIFKYVLLDIPYQTFFLPLNSTILYVVTQFNEIVVYAQVDTSIGSFDTYEINMYNTGQVLDHNFDIDNYRGTAMLNNGSYVKHIFINKKV